MEDLRRQFVRHGAADKPFWIMESGWSTCTRQSVDCVTPAQQAADLETMWGYLHTTWKSWVQALFVYRYQDGDPSNSVQGGYGLVTTERRSRRSRSSSRTRRNPLTDA